MADAVGKDNEIARSVERLSGTKQDVSKPGRKKTRSCAARPMPDQNRVTHDTRTVLQGLADRAVMNPQLREDLSAVKMKIGNDEVVFNRRRIVLRRSGRLREHHGETNQSESVREVHCRFLEVCAV